MDEVSRELMTMRLQVRAAEDLIGHWQHTRDPEAHTQARAALAEVTRYSGRCSAALAGADPQAVAATQAAHDRQEAP